MYIHTALLLVSAILFIHGYYKNGTVYIAFRALKEENYDKAEQLLLKIKNPDILSSSQKGYYHFTKGLIASNRENWNDSFSELNQALDIGVRTENDTSIILLNLANVTLEQNKIEEASHYIKRVREFNLKPLVEEQAVKIAEEIRTAQQKNND